MENGHRLEQQFIQLGFRVKLIDEIASPQCITYYFDCVNIADYSVRRIEKLLEKMSAFNHIKFSRVETTKSHFAITHGIAQRQPLFLTSFNFEPNYTTDIKIPIGKDLNNNVVNLDFGKIPHILIGGTTGSGKSVLLNTMLCSLLATTPTKSFDLVLIDPKKVELSMYQSLPNTTFIDDVNNAVFYLNQLCETMEMRYEYLEKENLKDGKDKLKPIFVIVDELADLMLTSRYEVEESIVRLAQKSRAVNIHLILATQSPRAVVITGLIKANIDCKIALKMASYRESVILLDHKGSENLLGFGDCLIKLPNQVEEIRTQIAFVSDNKIKELIKLRG